MGKAEAGTPKWLANKMKSKGLQKLRWYCQMCEKQCRDENGFKCHTSSEAHQRQLLLFAEKPGQFLDSYSQEFESGFLNLLKRCHGTKRIFANAVYQEYIKDKEHVHMNATKWVTLTGFVKHLGKSGKCTVDETEKGWYITWIDRDPETIARQEASAKKDKLAKDDEERLAEFIKKQVEADKERTGTSSKDEVQYTELKRNEDEKIKLGLKLSSTTQSAASISTSRVNVFKSSDPSKRESKEKGDKQSRKRASAIEDIMQEELKQKKKDSKAWLAKGIMVKIVAKSLGEKYHKQKGQVKELIDPYTAVVVTNSGAKLKLDQDHLETVIPAIGRKVLILRGQYKGSEAELREIQVEKFQAQMELLQDRNVVTLPYEDFSKIA